jgi:hypothetical protein
MLQQPFRRLRIHGKLMTAGCAAVRNRVMALGTAGPLMRQGCIEMLAEYIEMLAEYIEVPPECTAMSRVYTVSLAECTPDSARCNAIRPTGYNLTPVEARKSYVYRHSWFPVFELHPTGQA